MAKKGGKFDYMFPDILSKKTKGPLKVYYEKPCLDSRRNGKGTETACIDHADLKDIEDIVQKMSIEDLMKDLEKHAKDVQAGLIKTGEWSLGKRIDKTNPSPYGCRQGDNAIKGIPYGKTREFYLGKPVLKHVQTSRERRMLHQKLGYTDEDMEDIRGVFKGCDPELVAWEVLCVKGMNPEKAMNILPYLGVSKYSTKELKDMYEKIPEKDKDIENVLFFNSKEYGADLDAYKNDKRAKRVEEAKKRQYLARPTASTAPQGTPSP